MNKAFFERNWQLILCNITLVICFIIGYGRFGDIIVDSFREAYIPSQVLAGKALYKDIFVIYPPLSYLINTALLFIFGVKLKVLYFAGFAASVGIINLVFKIASKFMNKTHACAVVLFIISASALSPNVFNLFFPYSYGVLYGLLFILASVYCVIKNEYIWAYFLYSLALCSKYEYILFLPLLIWMSRKQNWLKILSAFFIPMIFISAVLVMQGVTFESILTSLKWIISISSAKTLYWFYSVSGLVFRPQLIPVYLINFFKYLIPFLLVYYFRNIWIVLVTAVYLWFFVDPEILIYAFPLIFILFIFRHSRLGRRKNFFILASLLISIKLFFALTLQSYGVYFLPLALISLYILMPKKFKNALFVMILVSSFVIGIKNIESLMQKSVKIETQHGVVYTTPFYGNSINALVEYIEKNTKNEDTVLVLPEGLSVNFLAGRKSDNKFYSQIPLYVEIFGDELIEKRMEFKKPECIVLTNYNTSNYYYSSYGADYAEEVYKYILKNYDLVQKYDNGLGINIFKIK